MEMEVKSIILTIMFKSSKEGVVGDTFIIKDNTLTQDIHSL